MASAYVAAAKLFGRDNVYHVDRWEGKIRYHRYRFFSFFILKEEKDYFLSSMEGINIVRAPRDKHVSGPARIAQKQRAIRTAYIVSIRNLYSMISAGGGLSLL